MLLFTGGGSVLRRRAAVLLFLLTVGASSHIRIAAANRDPFIQELMAGANGDSRVQFIVINQDTNGQNLWGPNGGAQSRAMLVFYDALDRETGIFKFPANPPTGGTLKTLIATSTFAALTGAPTPDIVIPPMLNAISGKVCLRANPANPGFARNECVSYGAFAGDTETNSGPQDGSVAAGSPAASSGLPIVNVVSLRRSADTGRNSDFALTTSPTPMNIAGQTFSLSPASTADQGQNLFTLETFSGNGRTCATCHALNRNLRLTPADVASSFSSLSTTFNPLFVGEAAPSSFDAGFDANLNTLTLAAAPANAAPCIGELRGKITSAGASATVLARVSAVKYLVYGGRSPALSGTVSDTNSCSATVSSIVAGDLAVPSGSSTFGLEFPRRMRQTNGIFPAGRALILENIDGFPPVAPVFRKSPHLLNLTRTAPYGFSGDIPNLQAFATGAVTQHFPRTLTRAGAGSAPDFRLPTAAELAAMEAFMLAQEFPAGSDSGKFDLDRYATTAAQRRGRASFFGSAKCSRCHGGTVLSTTTVSIQGKAIGINGSFNTGVVNQGVNQLDGLAPEINGAREFSVPQLFNLRNVAPYFHDASASTIAAAVAFYNTGTFDASPAGLAIGRINIGSTTRSDLTAFLNGLTTRDYTMTASSIQFGAQLLAAGATAARSITVTNTSGGTLSFTSPQCSLTNQTAGANFAVTSCPLTTALAPGESRIVQVTFDPSTNGAKTAILELNTAVPSGIDLSGVGTDLPPPTLTSVSPTAGRGSGGTVVTIAGTGFVAGATVSIGGAGAGSVSIISSTSLTAVASSHAAGLASVVVTNPDTQSATLTNAFNYLGATAQFSDDPLTARATSIRAIHLIELRQYIGDLRSRFGLAVAWTDPEIVAGTTTIKAVHITELQAALSEVYVAASRTPPSFAAVAAGAPITAAQVAELRAAIRAIW